MTSRANKGDRRAKRVVASFATDRRTLRDIDAFAAARGVTRSELLSDIVARVIRKQPDEGLDNEENEDVE